MISVVAMTGLLLMQTVPARAVEPPKVWAVVVGIDRYEDARLAPNVGAGSDARAVANWLIDTAGWPSANVLIMDDTSRKVHGPAAQNIPDLYPTRAHLDWAIREWLPYRARAGDVVLVYFAGQALGGKLADPSAHDLLVPIDAVADRLDRTGWSLADALDTIGQKGENPVLTLLDTSLSGRGRPLVDLEGRRTESSRLLGELTRWPGTASWIAADGCPSLVAASPRQRGAFVATLVEALGTPEKPINLLGALFSAGRDARLADRGFRAAGALGPTMSLWPKMLAEAAPPPSELLLQRGHADRLMALAFSADGGTAVTASMDSTLKVWRTADRTLLRTLPAHLIGVTALALSPDGGWVASGDGSGRVLLWSLADLRPRRFSGPPPHEALIARLEFLRGGSGFVSLDNQGRVVAWTLDGRNLRPNPITEGATAIAAGRDWFVVAREPTARGVEITAHDLNGQRLRTLRDAEGSIGSEALAVQGDRIVAGDDAGHVREWSFALDRVKRRFDAKNQIEALAFAGTTILAADSAAVWCIGKDPKQPPKSIPYEGPAATIATAPEGRSAAVVTTGGAIVALRRGAGDAWERVPLDSEPEEPQALSAAFAPGGERLVSGDQDGGVRLWEWPSGAKLGRIAPSRGRIDAMAASKDGRRLVQIDHDFAARLWDLREGRGLTAIPGQWIGAAFAPDAKTLAMSAKGGDLALFDAVTAARKGATFRRPRGEDGQTIAWGFGPVAISPDGRFLTAGGREGPIAAIWPIGGGEPLSTALDHAEPIAAVGFSSDSRLWATASIDGTVRIRPLNADAPLWTLTTPASDDTKADPAVTAMALAPGPLARVYTGHRDGRIYAWDLKAKGEAVPRRLTQLEGEVRSLAISDDGSRLISGGADKTGWVWTFEPGTWPPREPKRLEPQHTERVNAVVSLLGGRLIASASDDTSIRFWKGDGTALVGTVATSAEDGTWVAFDPAGRFDSAPGGESQVMYLRGDRVVSLDQYDASARVYGLGSMWLDGQTLPAASPFLAGRPSGLAIDPPLARRAGQDEVELRVRLGQAAPATLRLYRNDVPVREAEDFGPTDEPGVYAVKARLESGENRFVAMGARPDQGAIFGRSNAAIVRGPRPDEVPRGAVHTLALGISKYDSNPLRFADGDAASLSNFLERNGFAAGDKRGVSKLLRNEEVRPEAVEKALEAIDDAARPEDTVVIFLAGHTDVRRDERFYLLLDKFPFADDALTQGQRGPIRARGGVGEPDITRSILPYAMIYRSLARMDAKNRLVVIDACQAGAIFDDPGVERIRRKVDDGAHGARTSYLLAARKGEPANEAAVLRHGLMTYLILRGMGSPDLEPVPGLDLGTADLDANDVVTTDELRQYLDAYLPPLAARVVQAPAGQPGGRGPVGANLAPFSARGATATFPVSRLPRAK